MNKIDILAKIKSKNVHLNNIIEPYLLTHLDKPILGNGNFGDIEYFVEFGLNEYRINNYQENGYDYERKTIAELCEQFNISNKTYELFKQNINDILRTYTDKSLQNTRDAIKEQIKAFSYGRAEDDDLNKMYERLLKDEEYDKFTYIDKIIHDINKLGINQISNNEYIVITKLFQKYNSFPTDFSNFTEKKKYLKKLKGKGDVDKIPEVLAKYFKEIYNQEHTNENALESIQWFYFYLIHGKAKLIAYLMDSVLGDKCKSTQTLVQKLFLLDHTAGQSPDNFNFTHHNWISEIHTVEYSEKNEYNPLYQEIIEKL